MPYEQTKAWREANPGKAHNWKAKYRASTGSFTAPRRGARWSPREDALVVAHDVPDRALAQRLQRSLHAIQCRRARLRAGLVR